MARHGERHGPLGGDMEFEACVVGAGVAGLAAAHQRHRREGCRRCERLQRASGTCSHTPARPITFLRNTFSEKNLEKRLIRHIALIR